MTWQSCQGWKRRSPLLSVIVGMVGFAGFFTLDHAFTTQVTGNIVLAAWPSTQVVSLR